MPSVMQASHVASSGHPVANRRMTRRPRRPRARCKQRSGLRLRRARRRAAPESRDRCRREGPSPRSPALPPPAPSRSPALRPPARCRLCVKHLQQTKQIERHPLGMRVCACDLTTAPLTTSLMHGTSKGRNTLIFILVRPVHGDVFFRSGVGMPIVAFVTHALLNVNTC